ncbi:PREDICTED: shugoshin-1-like [Ipomoea nil]|uniref:shugoshin-1-like n=1 Tax=Ipomoea nil TaxID=35883 RepID=UPI000900A1D3|nr:PREDICTED: shugoshin-1-like [Ipomoea nil]
MKGDKMAKRSSFGSIVSKRLSDITNSLPQPKSPIHVKNDASSTKDYVDYLVKENMALVKLIQDKKKIIELSANELRKLRVNLQKMQLQNWHLAQSNSHMLAELNLNKEKLKSLQHEIACKEALSKAKNLEVKEQESISNTMNEERKDGEAAVGNSLPNAESKPSKSNRRIRARRCRSMSHSTASPEAAKEEAAEKRRRLRRQSASSRIQQQQKQEPVEDLFELEIVDDPNPPPLHSCCANEEASNEKDGCGVVGQVVSNRTCIGRPLRRAAEKVQSYKEIPINIKMRRAD